MLIQSAKPLAKAAIRSTHPLWSANAALAKRNRLFKPLIVHLASRGWVLSEVRDALRRPLSTHYTFMPQFMSKYMWYAVRGSIVHFGSPSGYVELQEYLKVHPSNRQILTWTHGQRSNPDPVFARRLDSIASASLFLDRIVAVSRVGEDTLVAEGVDRKKVVCIPLGIDTQLFTPPAAEQRAAVRRQLGIPESAVCIGSFQSDGEGPGEGMTPKWVKGPEVFLKVVGRLRYDYELFVLLTGPARGYVKAGLDRMGVSYRHVWLKNYEDVAKHFWALDMYVIASRDEGGPMAVLESMASGVPLVSTRVGMSIDLIVDGVNGYLSDVEDAKSLVANAAKILECPYLRRRLSSNGVITARDHDWSVIAARFHKEVYRPLLVEDGYRFTA